MIRRMLAILLCVSLLTVQGLAADRDPNSNSVRGIPKHNKKYFWSVLGGAALGAGIGVLAPGGAKSAWKGVLIGGSGASALYLARHRHEYPPAAFIVTNTVLGVGLGWTVCNCNDGALAGGLIGGGGTALIQVFRTRNRTLAKVTGTAPASPSSTSPSGGTQQTPPAPPPQQTTPPPSQTPPPSTKPPNENDEQPDQPPELPDSPQPKEPR
jgi:uncharacterized membrane protein